MPGFAYLEETIDMDRQMIKTGKHIKWLTETSSISRKTTNLSKRHKSITE
jgi:hypothetical protein